MDGRRDRLSSLDQLPDLAQEDVRWALRELNARQRTYEEIRFDLNVRLAAKGLGPISSSAFGRKAIRQKALRHRMDVAREVLAGVADLTAGDVDEQTVKIGHIIMMLIAELIADGEDREPKEIKAIADAFKAIVTGQKISAERRRKVEAEAEAREKAKTAAAVEKVAKEAGLSPEMVAQLRREFLGVRPKAPDQAPPEAALDGA